MGNGALVGLGRDPVPSKRLFPAGASFPTLSHAHGLADGLALRGTASWPPVGRVELVGPACCVRWQPQRWLALERVTIMGWTMEPWLGTGRGLLADSKLQPPKAQTTSSPLARPRKSRAPPVTQRPSRTPCFLALSSCMQPWAKRSAALAAARYARRPITPSRTYAAKGRGHGPACWAQPYATSKSRAPHPSPSYARPIPAGTTPRPWPFIASDGYP